MQVLRQIFHIFPYHCHHVGCRDWKINYLRTCYCENKMAIIRENNARDEIRWLKCRERIKGWWERQPLVSAWERQESSGREGLSRRDSWPVSQPLCAHTSLICIRRSITAGRARKDQSSPLITSTCMKQFDYCLLRARFTVTFVNMRVYLSWQQYFTRLHGTYNVPTERKLLIFARRNIHC